MEKLTMFRCSVFYEMWMACDTDSERLELWQAIMEYGLFGKEPPQKFKRDFVNIRFILDKSTKISEERSKAWKLWWAPTWNSNAVKNWDIDIKQAKTSKTSKTSESDSISISYSTSSKKEEKNIRKEEMLEAFRNDDRFRRFINEDDAVTWWDFKQSSKKPYKDVKTFITALVKIMNVIKNYWGMPKSDRNRRNRFNFAVNEAIEKGWEWLNRYDSMEKVYESSKDDLYPNPKQNE